MRLAARILLSLHVDYSTTVLTRACVLTSTGPTLLLPLCLLLRRLPLPVLPLLLLPPLLLQLPHRRRCALAGFRVHSGSAVVWLCMRGVVHSSSGFGDSFGDIRTEFSVELRLRSHLRFLCRCSSCSQVTTRSFHVTTDAPPRRLRGVGEARLLGSGCWHGRPWCFLTCPQRLI